jgi:NAD(P)H-hydrate epimerase
MKIVNTFEVRDMDRTAIEKYGIAEELLMENAGQAAYAVISKEIGIKSIRNKKFIVFCGVGNNGGDGLVTARKIYSKGGKVKVFILGDPDKFKGAAKTNWLIVSKLALEIYRLKNTEEMTIKQGILDSDVLIDAIFGTGLSREVSGLYGEIIDFINQSGKKILSIDIPSGINGNNGKIMGKAIKADYTVTFGLPKFGNILYPGYKMGGKLYLSHISFPSSLYENDSLKIELNQPLKLPQRIIDGHKGNFGKVLFIAGAATYFGAPYFSSFSFMKAGGGYSCLAAPASMVPFIASKASEVVFIPQKETREGSISLDNKKALLEIAEKMDMVVLGPGLSLQEETQKLMRELIGEIKKPLLIDGDGLTAISKDLSIIRRREGMTILTPHLGEMSRLSGLGIAEIQNNKIDILRNTARDLKSIIDLKGSHSLIGCPDGRVFINMSSNSGMATAGSGDVLSGTIAAMHGLGLPLEKAVREGVFMHGFAGDLAARDKGEDGITAQDILDYLPQALKLFREEENDSLWKYYQGVEEI